MDPNKTDVRVEHASRSTVLLFPRGVSHKGGKASVGILDLTCSCELNDTPYYFIFSFFEIRIGYRLPFQQGVNL